MSGLGKKMRRKLLRDVAKAHRKETSGYGRGRRTLRDIIWATRIDLALLHAQVPPTSAQESSPLANESDADDHAED